MTSRTNSIYSLTSELNNENLASIYFLFGEDHFTINSAIKLIEKITKPLITTDFDKETVSLEKKASAADIIDLAYTFPFGSEKKLLIVKNFENLSNKKVLAEYIKKPTESTILVIANYGKISNLNVEPYKSLIKHNMIFEARELKGRELENWVERRCTKLSIKINSENVKTLIEIVGEDKSLLEMQLQKFKSFLSENVEITTEEIKKLSSATKEYSIFDLMNALGKGSKLNSIKVINNLLDNGKDLVFIVSMLTKYISVISQSIEFQQRNLSDFDASKAIGVSPYYYKNCKNASFLKNEKTLRQATNALYNTDLLIKTSNIDQKTLSIMMLGEIFLKNENKLTIN